MTRSRPSTTCTAEDPCYGCAHGVKTPLEHGGREWRSVKCPNCEQNDVYSRPTGTQRTAIPAPRPPSAVATSPTAAWTTANARTAAPGSQARGYDQCDREKGAAPSQPS